MIPNPFSASHQAFHRNLNQWHNENITPQTMWTSVHDDCLAPNGRKRSKFKCETYLLCYKLNFTNTPLHSKTNKPRILPSSKSNFLLWFIPPMNPSPLLIHQKNPHRCPSKWRYLNLDLQREERHHSAVDRQAPTLVEENHLKQQKRPSRGIRLSHPPELDLTYTKNGPFWSRSPPFRKPSFWMLVFGDVIPWRVLYFIFRVY